MTGSITQKLGAFNAATGFADIPPEITTRAEISLIHNLSVALAGRPYEMLAQAAARKFWAIPAEATLIADTGRASAEGAAFANAAVMNVRSQDDTHPASTSHPGTPVIAAALATAEVERASGPEFLTAVTLGYETLGRLGRDFSPKMSAAGFRAAGVLGSFGAAASAAKIMKLDADATAHAIGLAAHMGGGLSQVWEEGGSEFTIQMGQAARNGLTAARLASLGATAVPHAIEGKAGFLAAYARTTDPASGAVEGLGESWQLAEVTVKGHPVCAILQGPLDRLRSLVSEHGIGPEAVEGIHLFLSPFEAAFPGVDTTDSPTSPTAAKMSARFCLPLLLRDGAVTLESLKVLDDPYVAAFRDRIEVIADSTLEARLSRIEIEMRDGRRIRGIVDAPVGRPSHDEIAAFAESLAQEAGTTAASMHTLVDAVRGLRTAPDVSNLVAALRA